MAISRMQYSVLCDMDNKYGVIQTHNIIECNKLDNGYLISYKSSDSPDEPQLIFTTILVQLESLTATRKYIEIQSNKPILCPDQY